MPFTCANTWSCPVDKFYSSFLSERNRKIENQKLRYYRRRSTLKRRRNPSAVVVVYSLRRPCNVGRLFIESGRQARQQQLEKPKCQRCAASRGSGAGNTDEGVYPRNGEGGIALRSKGRVVYSLGGRGVTAGLVSCIDVTTWLYTKAVGTTRR